MNLWIYFWNFSLKNLKEIPEGIFLEIIGKLPEGAPNGISEENFEGMSTICGVFLDEKNANFPEISGEMFQETLENFLE